MWHFASLALAPFVVCGWLVWRASARQRARYHAQVTSRLAAMKFATQPVCVNILEALREVLAALDTLAARHYTRISLAVPEGLAAWEIPQRVHRELQARLHDAIRRSPCGRVLVTGHQLRDEVLVTVSQEAAVEATKLVFFPVPAKEAPARPWNATIQDAAAGLDHIVRAAPARSASTVAAPSTETKPILKERQNAQS